MNRALDRVLDGRLARMGEAFLGRLVPRSTARAGFFWSKKCDADCLNCISLYCAGHHHYDRQCREVYCENDGGTIYCYPNITRNRTCECC